MTFVSSKAQKTIMLNSNFSNNLDKVKVFWELFNVVLEILEPRFGNPFWEW
jgi:hypothetical protein